MASWNLEPIRANVHGHFSSELAPILTIESGDSVIFKTLDARWNIEPMTADGQPVRQIEPRDAQLDSGHCLVGPVAISGAEPGMVLEIQIDEIEVGSWGWTVAGGWPHPVNDRLGLENQKLFHFWELDSRSLRARNRQGWEVGLRPFMGVMGMTPDDSGVNSTAPPRFCGGNLDCKELVAGTSLFLPVAVSGGLFSVGDGHAVQGDGEVSVTAIECPMEQVKLTFLLHPELTFTAPRAKTPDAWITFGLHEDLQEATFLALSNMLDLLQEQYGFDRVNALAMASLTVDLRITQIVNGVQGVHAILRFDAIQI